MNNESIPSVDLLGLEDESCLQLASPADSASPRSSPNFLEMFQQLNRPEQLTYYRSFQVLCAGVLEKKTRNLSYSAKFFVLTPYRLLYYENQLCERLGGCFNIAALQAKELMCSGTQIRLKFLKGRIALRAASEETAEFWYSQLRGAIESLPMAANLKVFIDYGEKYWKRVSISPTEFESYAETLDLVLFRNKHIGASLQRLFTTSEYDHIGILLKNDLGQVMFMDITSNLGVTVTLWRRFIEQQGHKHCDRIAYRKLLLDRDQLPSDGLEQCLKELMGSKYEISLSKLLGSRPKARDLPAERTYFCSELVAEVYIRFGLLPPEQLASSYWPKHFADRLPLRKGALSDLMVVEYD